MGNPNNQPNPQLESMQNIAATVAWWSFSKEKKKEVFEKLLKDASEEKNEEKAYQIFNTVRVILLREINSSSLEWKTVKLNGGKTVQVCLPVRIQGPDEKMYYVPVTGPETWNFARQFNALPLTSAVFDQYHNQSFYVSKSPKHNAGAGTGAHFHTNSEYLNDNQYHLGMKSGAHKLWILSARGRVINHGFYVPAPKNVTKYLESCKPLPKGSCSSPGGSNLDSSYWLIQNRGAAHEGSNHWDYSQLLQLMRSDDLWGMKIEPTIGMGKFNLPSPRFLKLREAVVEGFSEVWDEPIKINPTTLP